MDKRRFVPVILIFLLFCLSCRMVETLSGNESAGTVENLWSDVPAFEGASKTDLAMPLGARLLIRTMMQGKVNFIAFTTNRSAQEVQNFYNDARMHQSGWETSEAGCTGDTQDGESRGVICFFKRADGGKEEGLAIIVAQDQKTGKTDIFYARFDLSEQGKTPSS
jgi:hypothetical protein